jgi:hypothetical protein
LKNGWQPYISVAMVWNIIDKTKFKANEVSLPEMSIDPYVQYGVGIQKTLGDRFTCYLETMIHGGGRNGLALLSFYFKWNIGKVKKYEKI